MIVLVVWRTERIKQNEVEKLSDSLQENIRASLVYMQDIMQAS